eukprot:c24025_g1_i3 orf=357-632(+)
MWIGEEKTTSRRDIQGANWCHTEMKPLSNNSSRNGCLQALASGAMGMENQKAGCLNMELYAGGMSECVTLVLPSGDHGVPDGRAKGALFFD